MSVAKKPNCFIATPIYYVNGPPNVGSALCCDFLARYHKLRGFDAWLLTGTDENAAKVQEAAARAGKPAMEYVDGLTEAFHASCAEDIRRNSCRVECDEDRCRNRFSPRRSAPHSIKQMSFVSISI